DPATKRFDEIIAIPIFSTETREVISALVVGFKPFELAGKGAGAEMKSGVWVNGDLHLPLVPEPEQAALSDQIARVVSRTNRSRNNYTVTVNGAPQLLFYKQLNPNSLYPPAY